MMLTKEEQRKGRHLRVRRVVFGSKERPRLSVHRSLKHLHLQLIDDAAQKTLLSFSTLDKLFREKHPKGGTVEAATRLGEFLAKEASAKGITKVVFDRGGYLYHGRIKAVAEACRKGGLQF